MRDPLDRYYTPDWLIDGLLADLPFTRERLGDFSTVLEPCVGQGAIANPLRRIGAEVITNDLDPLVEADYHLDITQAESWAQMPRPDWVVTNIPFGVAQEIVPHAVAASRLGTIMLLRLSWLEPTKRRRDWQRANPPDAIRIGSRPSFTGDGKADSVTSAWFFWLHDDVCKAEARSKPFGWIWRE